MKFFLLIPVYNDWNSLKILLLKIYKSFYNAKIFNVVILNDNSKKSFNIKKKVINKFNSFIILNIKKNIGSQRAIAVGLNFISKKHKYFKILIMDADGEDNPLLINKIIKKSNEYPNDAIVVFRTKRKENFLIKLFYELHILICFILSGQIVRFGNFSLINHIHVKNLITDSSLWFAYSSSVKKKVKNFKKIFAEKNKRYVDKSNLSYFDLFNHSLRILIPFKEKIIICSAIYLFFFIFFIKKEFLIYLSLLIFFFINSLIYIYYFFTIRKKQINLFSLINNVKNIK